MEIAHRVGLITRLGARGMIVRMQRYAAKEAIIKLAKEEGVIHFLGMKVRIFLDLTTEMAKRRSQFQDVRV